MNVVYEIQREKRKKGPSLPLFFSSGHKKSPGKKDEEELSNIVQLFEIT